MSTGAYELLASGMRYVFAALMVLIVFRAWRNTAVDRARAAKLRRLSPETGIIGELLVVEGDEKARTGMHYPLTLEGSMGTSAKSDIRIRSSSVRRRHAYFQMTEKGLFLRGHASARLRSGAGRVERELVLHDGDSFSVGRVHLMLVLTGADAAPEEISRTVRRRTANAADTRRERSERERTRPRDYDEEIFDITEDPDELFLSNPAAQRSAGDRWDASDDDFASGTEMNRRKERKHR